MKKYFDNVYVYLLWLKYLRNNKAAAPLIGYFSEKQMHVAKAMAVKKGTTEFYAEAELLGEPGVDLITQYQASLFADGNNMYYPLLTKEGDIFVSFVNRLQAINPELLNNRYLYLEADLASGKTTKTSMFISLSYELENILDDVLLEVGAGEYLPTLKRCLRCVAPTLVLLHLGFMRGRSEQALRVVLYARDSSPELIMQALERLGPEGERFALQIKERLLLADALNIFEYIIDLDILPDGSWGDIIGLELLLKDDTLERQKVLFQSEAYKRLLQYFKAWKISDDRVDIVQNCVFAMPVTDPFNGAYFVHSRLSHFKLRWKKGVPMAAKAYLQLATEFLTDTLSK